MKWYRYAPDWLGDGGIRLAGDGVERVEDPTDSDWLVIAACLFVPWRKRAAGAWDRLWSDPLIAANPQRVVAYDCSDDGCRFGDGETEWPRPPMPGVRYFRCGLTSRQREDYPSAIPWPWPSPDLSVWTDHYPLTPITPIGFVGWKTPRDETPRAVASCQRVFGAAVDLRMRKEFHGHRHAKAGNHRPDDPPPEPIATDEREYRDGIFNALTVLCPQSIDGVLRYRVTEAMSAARVPVIVGGNYELPWADRVPWDECTIQIPSAEADRTGEIVQARLREWGATETLRRGRVAQIAYRRWLDKDRFPELMAEHLTEATP